ncbi:precorrin-3B synthase [Acetobacter oeni]|uniref:Precorrin-3B synthase n=1 Tax=Acetobacter oeni TaxID=304077 RepID=A0A511XKR0_9PROT|nr:precorrin-3B synthase [Acetobacter oeni]MBB3883777.1 precorrin-3B synthase [Acetobacter oeni]NHO19877.1 precorrin-3B synthase [Acetobacter oeni]GBR10374.1 precorrin-3B synthase [Acetobacter oeni LMG 21952]GEN63532.1 precorrin-3B synthase [Acetobacter oeni]
MTTPLIKGWCPGALRPMLSGDGLLVRVRPSAGRLTQAQASGIAHLAARHGSGLIDLSARANLQIRGVTDHTYAPLVSGLAALGLIDPTPEAEARRNIVVTPYWQAGDDTAELAEHLSRVLLDDRTLTLSGKFGFAVDTGPQPVLHDVSADIRIERDSTGSLLCRADGVARGARVTPDSMADAALTLVRWFVASGGRGRMAAHLANGATLPATFAACEAAPTRAAPFPASPVPAPGLSTAGFMIGLAFGQMHARTLAALATLAPLRVTPWRMLLLEGQTRAPDISGIITRPDDPLLHVVACTGAPACTQGVQPTRKLARALAPHIPAGTLLHLSGCTKGCAHPGPAALTLAAHAQGFDLIRNGTAAAPPVRRGLTAEHLLATPGILTEGTDAPSL